MLVRRISSVLSILAIFCYLVFSSLSGARAADTATASSPNLGVQDYSAAGVQVVLLSVKRTSDGFLTIKWGYHNTTNSPKQIGEDSTAMAGAWSAPFSLAWDMYVTAAGTQFKVANAPNGDLLAGTHPGPAKTVVVGPKQTYNTWAKLHAPPSDVTKVTVTIQGVSPFEDIAIGS